MRDKILSCLMIAAALFIDSSAFSDQSIRTSSVNIAVQNIFSMEFYNDGNILFRDTIPFTNIDPNKSMVYPDGRSENDGKSDTAVVCRSNAGGDWYLKLHVIPTPPLTADKMKYYIGQPYNRNTGSQSDGSLTQSAQWYPFSDKPVSIYVSGASDQSNLPFGTLITFNFAINPSGLNAGQAYSAAVVYTMTQTP